MAPGVSCVALPFNNAAMFIGRLPENCASVTTSWPSPHWITKLCLFASITVPGGASLLSFRVCAIQNLTRSLPKKLKQLGVGLNALIRRAMDPCVILPLDRVLFFSNFMRVICLVVVLGLRCGQRSVDVVECKQQRFGPDFGEAVV